MSPPATRQQTLRVLELCAGLMRAYSGTADVHFRGHRPHRGNRALPWYAPHLYPAPEDDDLASLRGAADGLALRLAISDEALHRGLEPEHPAERLVFSLLEQFRVEALAPECMPGMRRNLRHRHDQWSLAFHHAGHTDEPSGLLLYAIAQICRARVCGQPLLQETEGRLESIRFALAPLIGHALAGLRRDRGDQAAYAVHARELARTVAAQLAAAEAESAQYHPPARESRNRLPPLDEKSKRPAIEDFAAGPHRDGPPAEAEPEQDGYRIFTGAYDREQASATLVRPALLGDYRARLDRLISRQGINVGRLAHQLRARLGTPRTDGWKTGREAGHIDGRRLSQLIASPNENRIFRALRVEQGADCAVSFLIDCSGSMKDRAESVAMLVDVYARALEQAGVDCEILGYTTGAWHGGRARRDWLRAGQPAQPGRLNERCHIVFKLPDASWRRSRLAIAALLKSELFREGIDGEAVQWACERLRRRPEARRILLVISDGSPMDGATHAANHPGYLDAHLREVIARNELDGAIEIAAIGVGLDLSPYYRRSVTIDGMGGIGNRELAQIATLLAQGRQSR